jgi:segregation and condensation protein B
MNQKKIKDIVEAALLAAGRPLTLDQLSVLFSEDERPPAPQLKKALDQLAKDYADRAIELKEVGSGFRIQVRATLAMWVQRLWEERPTRYSRALLETMALIAYRQPITRAEIEDVRGVSISTSIMKTLQDREWIRIVGHRDVPGRPAMYGTTRQFLDYFGIKSLDELPTLAELRDIDAITPELPFGDDAPAQAAAVEMMEEPATLKHGEDESDAEGQAPSPTRH